MRGSISVRDDPGLVGLTAGAAVVRTVQRTRHALNLLRRVTLIGGAADSEADAAKPLHVALMVAQDVGRQLPFAVLPTVLSAWVAMVQGKNQPGAPGGPPKPGTRPGNSASSLPAPARGSVQRTESGSSESQAPGSNGPAAAASTGQPRGLSVVVEGGGAGAPPTQQQQGTPRPVNRARQLKMTETMGVGAAERWAALSEYERKMMVQVRGAGKSVCVFVWAQGVGEQEHGCGGGLHDPHVPTLWT